MFSIKDLAAAINGKANTTQPSKTAKRTTTPPAKANLKAVTPQTAPKKSYKDFEDRLLPVGKTFFFECYSEHLKEQGLNVKTVSEDFVPCSPEDRAANVKWLAENGYTQYPAYLVVTHAFAGPTKWGWSVKVVGRMVSLLVKDDTGDQLVDDREVTLVNIYANEKSNLEPREGRVGYGKDGLRVELDEYQTRIGAELRSAEAIAKSALAVGFVQK